MTAYAALCVAATCLLLVFERTPLSGRPAATKIAAKTTASLAFVAHAVALGVPQMGTVGVLLMVALALSVVGDLCLLFRGGFLVGLGAFLLAHVAFSAAFLLAGVSAWGVAVALLPLGALVWGVWRWLSPRLGGMAPAVAAYIVVIVAMAATAMGSVVADPSTHRWIIGIAAVMFVVSDLFVARERFVRATWWNKLAGLPLYYGAQLLFGIGAMGLA